MAEHHGGDLGVEHPTGAARCAARVPHVSSMPAARHGTPSAPASFAHQLEERLRSRPSASIDNHHRLVGGWRSGRRRASARRSFPAGIRYGSRDERMAREADSQDTARGRMSETDPVHARLFFRQTEPGGIVSRKGEGLLYGTGRVCNPLPSVEEEKPTCAGTTKTPGPRRPRGRRAPRLAARPATPTVPGQAAEHQASRPCAPAIPSAGPPPAPACRCARD